MTDVVRFTFPVEVVVMEPATTAPDVEAIVEEAVRRIETAVDAQAR